MNTGATQLIKILSRLEFCKNYFTAKTILFGNFEVFAFLDFFK